MLTSTYISAATAAVTNWFVTSTNMIVGAYTVANATPAVAGARRITVTHTAVTGNDTLGTIVVVGKDLHGRTITETITPLAGTTATGVLFFASVTSVTGAGWVINTGNDTIVVGHDAAAVVAVGGGFVTSVTISTTSASTVTIADAGGTIAVLKASIAENTYQIDHAWSGFLSVTAAGATTLNIAHTSGVPSLYAMA